jgi:hypothetical protein
MWNLLRFVRKVGAGHPMSRSRKTLEGEAESKSNCKRKKAQPNRKAKNAVSQPKPMAPVGRRANICTLFGICDAPAAKCNSAARGDAKRLRVVLDGAAVVALRLTRKSAVIDVSASLGFSRSAWS